MKTFVPGEIARASDVNANFQELESQNTATAQKLEALTADGTLSPNPGWGATSVTNPTRLICRVTNGIATLFGSIKRASSGFSTTAWRVYDLATVTPRPKYGAVGVVPCNFNNGFVYITIDSRGTVSMQTYSNSSIHSGGWIVLDGISYVVSDS